MLRVRGLLPLLVSTTVPVSVFEKLVCTWIGMVFSEGPVQKPRVLTFSLGRQWVTGCATKRVGRGLPRAAYLPLALPAAPNSLMAQLTTMRAALLASVFWSLETKPPVFSSRSPRALVNFGVPVPSDLPES
jgi:hypothetical protein